MTAEEPKPKMTRSEVSSMGGKAAHKKGSAHEWTSEEAREAGRKGGQISRGGRGRLTVDSQPRDEKQLTDLERGDISAGDPKLL